MGDGAHLGVDAYRALKTVFGGEKHPEGAELKSRADVRARVMAALGPLGDEQPQTYADAADAIAKAMLLCVEADPKLIEDDRRDDLYGAVVKKYPGFDAWVRRATGFQVGWATNCVRWLFEKPPVANPAILTIEVEKPSR